MRLPRKYEFPFGYEIVTLQVPPDDPELEGRYANWDVDTRTIRVDKTLKPPEKRGAWLHEFDHAYNDWELWVAQNVAVKYPGGAEPDPAEKDEEE